MNSNEHQQNMQSNLQSNIQPTSQNPQQTPPRPPHKHFMSLGGGLGMPQKKITMGSVSLSPSALSNSFSIPREQAPINHLPDIYTTCPELRKFKALMVLSPYGDDSDVENNNNTQNKNQNNNDPIENNNIYNNSNISNIPNVSNTINNPNNPVNSILTNNVNNNFNGYKGSPIAVNNRIDIKPQKFIQQRPQEQQPIAPPLQRPMMPNHGPILFPVQRYPFPFQPFPVFQIFDPNAPVLRPHELGFVPRSEWPPQVFSLWDLRQMYFTRRNGAGRRFDFKLYNALCITKVFPPAYAFIGAMWIGPTLMKIHSLTFAHLLGIHAVQGGLFHKQGNFSRHGFQQVQKQSPQAIQLNIDLRDVDDYNVRLFTDQYNRFSRDTEFVITDSLPTPNDEDEEEEAASEK